MAKLLRLHNKTSINLENRQDIQLKKVNGTAGKILLYLKRKGEQSAAVLAKEFGITNEGMRLHLVKLMNEGLVKSEQFSKGVGRPTILFSLTEQGFEKFPDGHAELTVQLLTSIKTILGQDALDRLMEAREQENAVKYAHAIQGLKTVEEKLDSLVHLRTKEGYMAEWEADETGYTFIENHCPICAAAIKCSEICKAELKNLRLALGDGVEVKRIQQITEGARRCSYKITVTQTGNA